VREPAANTKQSENTVIEELEPVHSKDSWKGRDIELARQDGMLDIATQRPMVPAFKERSRRAEMIIAVFGLIALASPLALWIAWTRELLLLACGAGLASTLICWLTVRFSSGD
jgi:hypothetical protein